MVRKFIAKIWAKKEARKAVCPADEAVIKLLIIDANDLDRNLTKRALENRFWVADFSNLLNVIEFVKENPIDVVIINDSYSENINAAEVLFSLQQHCRKSFRAFAATRHYSESQRAFLLSAGFEELLCKPIDGAALTDLICFKRAERYNPFSYINGK